MAARSPKPRHRVPDADRLLDGRGDLWALLTPSTDRYACVWVNTRTDGGATWAVLDGGTYGPVLAYHSDEWAVA